MRLHAHNRRDHLGPEYTVTVDGEPVSETVILDTDEGWVEKYCEDPEHTDDGRAIKHRNPEDRREMCRRRITGEVAVFGPDGEPVDLAERPWLEGRDLEPT